jgi:large conductance mechanosensitive channel
MRSDLRSFFARATVVELLLAFAFAGTIVSFVTAVVNGVVISPIEQSSHDYPGSFSALAAAIFGRSFQFANILADALVLLLIAIGAAFLLRATDAVLWDQGAARTCPHCVSEIPAEAHVCSYCTRDVPPVRESEVGSIQPTS